MNEQTIWMLGAFFCMGAVLGVLLGCLFSTIGVKRAMKDLYSEPVEEKPKVHVCTQFTKWKQREEKFNRPAEPGERAAAVNGRITFTKKWQERECVECGKQQLEAKPLY